MGTKSEAKIYAGFRKSASGFVGYIRHYKDGRYYGYVSCKEIRPTKEEALQDAEVLKKQEEVGTTITVATRMGKLVIPPVPAKLPVAEQPKVEQELLLSASKCAFCGKPLTRQSSIQHGMGDVCEQHRSILGAQTLQEHYAEVSMQEQPDEKIWMRLDKAILAAAKAGISGHRFMQVCGGDRALRQPLLPVFEIRFYRHTRYIRKEALQHLEEARLK